MNVLSIASGRLLKPKLVQLYVIPVLHYCFFFLLILLFNLYHFIIGGPVPFGVVAAFAISSLKAHITSSFLEKFSLLGSNSYALRNLLGVLLVVKLNCRIFGHWKWSDIVIPIQAYILTSKSCWIPTAECDSKWKQRVTDYVVSILLVWPLKWNQHEISLSTVVASENTMKVGSSRPIT